MRVNWNSQRAVFGGALNFPDAWDRIAGVDHPIISIPLSIKDYAVPFRKQKITEMVTHDDGGAYDTSFGAAFYGTTEPLTAVFGGWFITPRSNGCWAIPGMPAHVSYAELVMAYIEGRMRVDATGRGHRVDPYEFVDPKEVS